MSDNIDRSIEKLSREELKNLQFKKLKGMLERIYHTNEFYKQRFKDARVHPDDIKSFEDFHTKIPTLSKEDCLAEQSEYPPYGRRAGVPEEEIFQIQLTSGTSGKGQEVFVVTKDDAVVAAQSWATWFIWAGMIKGDVVYNFFPMATGSAGLSLYDAFKYLETNTILAASYDVDTKISYMCRFKPHYMMTTPSYLMRLAVVCREKGIDPREEMARLKGVLIAAEGYPVEWAERMQEFWGATVHEMYGSTQYNGTLACTCENGVTTGGKRNPLHVLEHFAYVEINNPETGHPVQYGDDGEVVLTTFSRRGSPVVRFVTKDKVRLLPPDSCACGRPFMKWESGTISRYDDMIKMKATNIWPYTIDEIIFSFEEIEESHGTVFIDDQGKERVKVEIEFKEGVIAEAENQILKSLSQKIKSKTDVSMEVDKVDKGTLKRSELKARRWTDARKSNLQKIVRN